MLTEQIRLSDQYKIWPFPVPDILIILFPTSTLVIWYVSTIVHHVIIDVINKNKFLIVKIIWCSVPHQELFEI